MIGTPNEIFISYARADKAVVKPIVQAIKDQQVDPWFDEEDIPRGEKWWKAIQSGIRAANAFIFITSLSSLTKSEVCNGELDFALACRKKVIPVILRSTFETDPFKDEAFLAMLDTLNFKSQNDGTLINAGKNWHEIKAINAIFYEEPFTCAAAIIEIARQDLDHLQKHTRLLVRAEEWTSNKHNRNFLLRGDDLIEVEAWQASAADKLPQMSSLQAEYIYASRQDQRWRNRMLLSSGSTALIVMLVLAVLAFLQRNEAIYQQKIAQNSAATSNANATVAATSMGAALQGAGNSFFNLGEPTFAYPAYATSVKLVNEVPTDWYLNLARSCLRIADFSCALRNYQQVIVQDETFTSAYIESAIVYRELKEYSQAMTILDTAERVYIENGGSDLLEEQGEYSIARVRGSLLFAQNQWQAIINLARPYTEYEDMDPAYQEEIIFYVIMSYAAQNKLREACHYLEDYDAAVEAVRNLWVGIKPIGFEERISTASELKTRC